MVFHASHGAHPSLDLHQTCRAWLGVYCDRESDSSGVALIRHKRLRRTTGTVLVIMGTIFIWLAPEVLAGAILLVSLHGRAEGWKLSIFVLTAFALYSVIR